MPNLSFDIFYSTDIVNITASRSGGAPRVKPDWKVRQAPKLAPKQAPSPQSAFGRKQVSQRQPLRQLPAAKGIEAEKLQPEAAEDLTQKASKSNKVTPHNLDQRKEQKAGGSGVETKNPKLNKPITKSSEAK